MAQAQVVTDGRITQVHGFTIAAALIPRVSGPGARSRGHPASL